MKPKGKAATRSAPASRSSRGRLAVGVISLGCPKNQVDTEFIMGGLRRGGVDFVSDAGAADLLIVNTCAFIEPAGRESTEAIREILGRKAARPGTRVVVAGCLVNRFGRRLEREFPGVDLFLKPGQIERLPDWLADRGGPKWLRGGERGYRPSPGKGRLCITGPWAYLKLSDGCSNRCAYCLIPSIRGPHKSRSSGQILDEALGLLEAGIREINLVGQDITRWREGRGSRGLPDLLTRLAALPGDYRLRLLYLHPARIDEALIGVLAGNARIWPYLDMPIQHAHDRVLAAMNRPYGRRHLEKLYGRLRRDLPGAALRTTVMVGFPGEGRVEFETLLAFIRDHPFENLGVFIFSPQPGTAAAAMAGLPAPSESEERYHRLMSLQAGISSSLWKARVGTVTEALLTGPAGKGTSAWIGRTAWQAPEVDGLARFRGRGAAGAIVRVKITAHGAYDLRGEILGDGAPP